jgi:hypothetical protein
VRLWVVDRWEKGSKTILPQQLDQIAAALGMSFAPHGSGQSALSTHAETAEPSPLNPPSILDVSSSGIGGSPGEPQIGAETLDGLKGSLDDHHRVAVERSADSGGELSRESPPASGPTEEVQGNPREGMTNNGDLLQIAGRPNTGVEEPRRVTERDGAGDCQPRRQSVASTCTELDAVHRDIEPVLAALVGLAKQVRGLAGPHTEIGEPAQNENSVVRPPAG